MIEEGFKQPIIDFVDKAHHIPNLAGAVLFGSAVTGGISKKSDIDILLVFDSDHNPETGKEAEIARKIASAISIKHDLAHPFSFVFANRKKGEEIEPDFLWNISREGLLIWGKPEDILMKEPHPALEPMALITYSVKNLDENDRRRFLRKLYTSKKKLLDKKKERIGPGTILIKATKFDSIKEVLDDFNVRYSVKKVWGH